MIELIAYFLIGVVFPIFLVILIYALIVYNGLISLKNHIDKAWSNIDVLLKQRSDELPNLIATVKGYMKHEKSVLMELTEARTKIMQASTMSETAKESNIITSSLKTIFAVAENYPKLRANENFLKLQERISAIENQIADRREFYNDSVTNYNIRIEVLPDMLFAQMMKFQRKEMFKATPKEKKNVKTKF